MDMCADMCMDIVCGHVYGHVCGHVCSGRWSCTAISAAVQRGQYSAVRGSAAIGAVAREAVSSQTPFSIWRPAPSTLSSLVDRCRDSTILTR